MSVTQIEMVSNLYDAEGNEIISFESIQKVLDEKECIKQYAYILHDKDTYSEEEEEQNPEHKAGMLKKPHIHLMMKFSPNQQIEYIAKWFGVPENFLQKIKRGWKKAVAYLVHLNAEDKYQYDIAEVHANFDVQKILTTEKKKLRLDDVLQRIADGEIKEYNRTLLIDNVFYAKYKSKIDNAFKIRQEKVEVTEKERKMEVVYIWGAPQTGKSTFAKEIARAKGYAFYESSGSSDILEGYRQEEVILLQELRPDTMRCLSDLLKLLDNTTASSYNSRYRNKYVNAKMIIITTIVDMETFYKGIYSTIPEPIEQFKRRCGVYIYMTRENIFVSRWDAKAMRYTEAIKYRNTIAEKYIPKEELTKEAVAKDIAKLMPFLAKDELPEESSDV